MRRGYIKSLITTLVCGVPQESELGPVLFVMYTVDLIQRIENNGLLPHLCMRMIQCTALAHLLISALF